MKGYVQVYTGDGKGKTTAALGLLLRATGAGLKTYLGQFIKQGDYSEIRLLRDRFPEVTIEQYGRGRFIREPSPEDIAAAAEGLHRLKEAVGRGKYDLVIADEANGAVRAGLFKVEALLEIMDSRAEGTELVITGRGADRRVIERADLVTEMQPLKHYFEAGIAARPGIES